MEGGSGGGAGVAGKGVGEVKTMETYLMTDQPPTCPQCGRRVRIIEGAETQRQICECPACHFIYALEDDGEGEL